MAPAKPSRPIRRCSIHTDCCPETQAPSSRIKVVNDPSATDITLQPNVRFPGRKADIVIGELLHRVCDHGRLVAPEPTAADAICRIAESALTLNREPHRHEKLGAQ
jgi:hypothetical protein